MKSTRTVLALRLAKAEAELARLRAAEHTPVREPSQAADAIRAACHPEQECFVVLLFDARSRLLLSVVTAMGSVAAVDVHPRDVFREAVRLNAHSIVIGHNHPSGDTTPSPADMSLTRKLVDASAILGIPILDHLIVSHSSHYSFAFAGMLPFVRT